MTGLIKMFSGQPRPAPSAGNETPGRCVACGRRTTRVTEVGTPMNPSRANACERCVPERKGR